MMTSKKTLTPVELGKVLTEKLKIATVEPLKPVENDIAFNALLEKIRQARQDIKAIKGFVNDALKLALKDFLIHKNKNSLEKLITFKVDFTKSGRGLALYNLYNVKAYLDELGLKLDYNIKQEKVDIFYKVDFNLSFEDEQAFFEWYNKNSLSDFKKPVEKQVIKPATFESIKQALKQRKLSYEEIAVLKSLIKETTP